MEALLAVHCTDRSCQRMRVEPRLNLRQTLSLLEIGMDGYIDPGCSHAEKDSTSRMSKAFSITDDNANSDSAINVEGERRNATGRQDVTLVSTLGEYGLGWITSTSRLTSLRLQCSYGHQLRQGRGCESSAL